MIDQDPSAAVPVASVACASALPLTPVGEGERVVMIDVLRGFAILGVLIVNIQFFAFTVSGATDWHWEGLSPADSLARGAIQFFAEAKFITLFSILFGMGLAIQSERAAAKGRSFVGTYVRRLVVLLLIGAAHATLLWYGDILLCYALVGFIALLFHKARPRTLMIVAIVMFFVPVLFMTSCTVLMPGEMAQSSMDWNYIAKQNNATSSDQPAYEFFEFMADEERVYQSGTWSDMVLHRSATYAMIWFAMLIVYNWRVLAMFLLGIYFIRRRVFTEPDRHRGTYRRMVGIGLGVGLPLQLLALTAHRLDPESGWVFLLYFLGLYLGSMCLALAYAGIVALVCLNKDWLDRLSPVAAVGRTALTNYLSHSVICGFIFYSYGLGQFNRIGYWSALLIVFAIFAAQLVISPIWLRFFKFGPLEWMWRSLAYWKAQPMLRTQSV
jgi:uncharacterized protein